MDMSRTMIIRLEGLPEEETRSIHIGRWAPEHMRYKTVCNRLFHGGHVFPWPLDSEKAPAVTCKDCLQRWEGDRTDLLQVIAGLDQDVALLKDALRKAIVDRARVSKRTVEVDPAGDVYEYDWLARVRRWARLCDLDLDKVDPCSYGDFYA